MLSFHDAPFLSLLFRRDFLHEMAVFFVDAALGGLVCGL